MTDENRNDTLNEGYLVYGDQVAGGTTLQFPKRNKYYFVLRANGEFSFLFQAYKNESAYKGKQSKSGRRPSITPVSPTGLVPNTIIDILLTSSIKVHCHDMKIGRKVCHVIILIHGNFPYYFKTVQDGDIRKWYKALSTVAHIMEKRKVPDVPEIIVTHGHHGQKDGHDLQPGTVRKHLDKRASEDSGRGSISNPPSNRSSRSSIGSQGSDYAAACPPSPRLMPVNFCFELEDDEVEQIDNNIKKRTRRELAKSVILRRRVNKDSSGEETGLVAYEEAPDSIYDSFIRRSTAPHDDDEASHILDHGDHPVTVLPRKNSHLDRGTSLERSDATDGGRPRLRRGTAVDIGRQASSVPPPLPARPKVPFTLSLRCQDSHHYVNTGQLGRPQRRTRDKSSPAVMLSDPISIVTGLDRDEQRQENRKDMGFIRWEKSKSYIDETFSKAELLDTIILTTINKEVWVAGWKKDLNKQLHGKLRVGDRVLQINTQMVTDAKLAMDFVRTTAEDEIKVRLQRLPKAEVVELERSSFVHWGIEVRHNEIKSVKDGPARRSGITAKAPCALTEPEKGKQCDWIITEISHKPVPITRIGHNQEFVKAELESPHNKTSLPIIIQPSDLIKKLADSVPKRIQSIYF